MIILGRQAEVEDIVCRLPEYAIGKGAKRLVPSITFSRPSTASITAAQSAARRCIPGRDEDETVEDYLARLNPVLEHLGFSRLSGKADIQDAVRGIMHELMLDQLARIHIKSWEGFGDTDKKPLEPTPEAVAQALRDKIIADRVMTALLDSRLPVVEEGNA